MTGRWPLPMLVVAAALATGSAAGADATVTDARGRRFRVEFDPASQLRMGVVGGVAAAGRQAAAATALETGASLRTVTRYGKHRDMVRWQLDHRIAWGHVMPWTEAAGGLRPMDASAYAGTWLRHAEASYLMLPTDPPRNLYFPLDIGVDMEFGRVQVAPSIGSKEPAPQVLRLGAARASVLLDPLRSNRTGNSLEFGLGSRYDIDLAGRPGVDSAVVVHRVSPFTATSLRWRWQDAKGLTATDLSGTWHPHWASEGRWVVRAAECKGRLQRVLVAVNDQPLAVVLDASYAVRAPIRGVEVNNELRVLAGVSMGVQLRK